MTSSIESVHCVRDVTETSGVNDLICPDRSIGLRNVVSGDLSLARHESWQRDSKGYGIVVRRHETQSTSDNSDAT